MCIWASFSNWRTYSIKYSSVRKKKKNNKKQPQEDEEVASALSTAATAAHKAEVLIF